jgi:uncharacterized lipoprotein
MMDRLGRSVLLSLFAFCLAGCPVLLGAGAGAGTYRLVQGDLAKLYYQAPYDTAWEAAFVTLEEMEMTVAKEDRGETEGKIEAKRFDGSPVRMILKQKSLDVTDVRVRVGVIGDRAKAELLHERFRENVYK